MADTKDKTTTVKPVGNPGSTTTVGNGDARLKMDKQFRPLASEIARLSATLGMARTACQTGDPGKVLKALALLGRQLPLAVETAELLAPEDSFPL